MNQQAYLEQVVTLDQTINRKLCEVESLRRLLTKASGIITGMPHCPSPDLQPIDTILAKIIDLDRDITADIDALVDQKREMEQRIERMTNPVFQNVLSLRYLCSQTWEQVAKNMNCDRRHVLRLHSYALEQFKDV